MADTARCMTEETDPDPLFNSLTRLVPVEEHRILPTQFVDADAAETSGEKRLMLAVLTEAVEDYRKFAKDTSRAGRHQFRTTQRYVDSNDRRWPYSFCNLCDVLNLNVSSVRRALRKYVIS